MYFWRITALKQHLTEHGQTDQQTFPYLLYLACAAATVLAAVCLLPGGHSIWRYLNAAGGIVISLLGLQHVYRRNGGVRGSEFLSRFISLAWVTLVRFAVAGGILIAILTMLQLNLPNAPWHGVLGSACFFIWYTAYYLYNGRQIHGIAKIRGELP